MYLGIHGEDFLRRLASSLYAKNHPSKVGAGSNTTEAELPIDGDASARMEGSLRQNEEASNYHKLFGVEQEQKLSSKPWWWYLVGIPLWIPVALEGSRGMNDRLAALDEEFQNPPASPIEGNTDTAANGGSTNDSTTTPAMSSQEFIVVNGRPTLSPTSHAASEEALSTTVVDANITNYGFAIFFIVFGTIALVAGVASNVYVAIHGIFAIPA